MAMPTGSPLWRDRYHAAGRAGERASSALFPYLAADFAFTEREPRRGAVAARIHCFNYGASVEPRQDERRHPGISEGAALAGARDCRRASTPRTSSSTGSDLLAYETPELRGDEWTDAEALSQLVG